MESDERFKHLATDPRFKVLRKKRRQVKIDDRFKSMFTDERFTLKYRKNKRGQKQLKSSTDDLKKYYALEEVPKLENFKEVSADNEEKGEEESIDENTDEEAEEENKKSDQDETESAVGESSSSSDESASEDDVDENEELDIDKINYDWQPLDADAEKADKTTNRIAVQNLDWDRLNVEDLFTLFNSIRKPISVKLYISEFGKERLKKEELEGPQEIVEMDQVDDAEEEEFNMLKGKMDKLQNPLPKSQRINEYEDADEMLNTKNEEVMERVRRYQISRMKYYYAIVEFDSVVSAELVYKELDGLEFEGSSLELDLRFVPEGTTFEEQDIRAQCNETPDLSTYKVPQFISSALQQTTVQFTWDQTDIKRQERLHRAYTKEELEKDDLEAYLASDTDSEEEGEYDSDNINDTVSVVTANSEARVNKYKNLLKSLEEESEKKKKDEVDIEWGNFSEEEEELGKKLAESSDQDLYTSEDSEASNQEGASSPEKVAKRGRNKGKRNKKTSIVGNDGDQALDLLVLDDVERKRADDFKFNPEDSRFNAIYSSGLYNIDPSHPNFKRTEAFDIMAEKKREKRQKTAGNSA